MSVQDFRLVQSSYPCVVTISSRFSDVIASIGTSSFHIAQGLFQEQRCLATCETVMVHLGPDGAAAPLSAQYRELLEPYRLGEGSTPIS